MKNNNQYWGLPITELEELGLERVMLFQDAWRRGQFDQARAYELELDLINEAMAAYGDGFKNIRVYKFERGHN